MRIVSQTVIMTLLMTKMMTTMTRRVYFLTECSAVHLEINIKPTINPVASSLTLVFTKICWVHSVLKRSMDFVVVLSPNWQLSSWNCFKEGWTMTLGADWTLNFLNFHTEIELAWHCKSFLERSMDFVVLSLSQQLSAWNCFKKGLTMSLVVQWTLNFLNFHTEIELA